MICGDFNSRTGNRSRPDFIQCDEIVHFLDSEDYCPDMPIHRFSMDTVCSSHVKFLDLRKSRVTYSER